MLHEEPLDGQVYGSGHFLRAQAEASLLVRCGAGCVGGTEAGFVLPATEGTAGRSSLLSAQARAASITITQGNLVFPHVLYY